MIKSIHDLNPLLPIILVTGYPSNYPDIRQSFKFGVVKVIEKPFTEDKAFIDSVLEWVKPRNGTS